MSTHLLVALFAVFVGSTISQAQTPEAPPDSEVLRIAHFSPQTVLSQSQYGQAAQQKLTILQSGHTKEVSTRNEIIARLRSSLQGQLATLDDSARRIREQEILGLQRDLQRFAEDAQMKLQGLQRDIETEFVERLRYVLGVVGKRRGLLVVLNSDTGLVVWADPALDITKEVVAAIDAP